VSYNLWKAAVLGKSVSTVRRVKFRDHARIYGMIARSVKVKVDTGLPVLVCKLPPKKILLLYSMVGSVPTAIFMPTMMPVPFVARIVLPQLNSDETVFDSITVIAI
jgi:hypothetical protein